MSENKIVEINPADYKISAKDVELVNKAGIRNVHIISYTPEYFSQQPKFEVMQYMTISETGEVTFDAYNAGEKFNELKTARKESKQIGMNNAKYIFHFLLRLLEKESYKDLEPRPGCWQAAIDYTNGERKNFYGPFYEETVVNGVDVNEFIKDIVQISNTNLFGRIDPLLQLEQTIDQFSQVTIESNLNYVYQALQYCVYKNVFVDTMVNASALAVAGNSGNNAGGFNIEALTLEDGEKAMVAMTSGERVNALPAAYFTMPFGDLCRYTLNQDVLGLFINPGSQNFLIPKDMLQAIVDSFNIQN